MSDTPKTQYDRFIETARALGCDEDEVAFDKKLKAIARQKPADDSKQSKKPDKGLQCPNGIDSTSTSGTGFDASTADLMVARLRGGDT